VRQPPEPPALAALHQAPEPQALAALQALAEPPALAALHQPPEPQEPPAVARVWWSRSASRHSRRLPAYSRRLAV
jgi:hypothetical protein